MISAVPHLHTDPSIPNHCKCADEMWGAVGGGGVRLGWRCERSIGSGLRCQRRPGVVVHNSKIALRMLMGWLWLVLLNWGSSVDA